jgi:ornithine lipid ester-linked acyl 2-hydroxylase
MDHPITDKNPLFFYDAADFDFLRPLSSNYESIKKELLTLLENKNKKWFTTYPHYVKSENDHSWQVFTFMLFGIRSKENASLCPKTAELLFSIPQIISADFSNLKPHTHILPHTGFTKTVLRCHLPLVVPEGNLCSIRVGNQERFWKEGELMIFDDSFEHEAWNRSDQERVVLMFDIPNPLWKYSAKEICKYRIETLQDKFLLSLAPKEKWLEMYEEGYFPLIPE